MRPSGSRGNPEIITIDGPAGAGKSTISRLLAEQLSYLYLDTGALYRAVAYGLQKEGWMGGEEGLSALLIRLRINLTRQGNQLHVFLNGEDVTGRIRSEEIGLLASKASALAPVRDALLGMQQEIGKTDSVVAEGRDMGTVVFPHAQNKFFLDATVQERALRRYRELCERGEAAELSEVEQDIEQRDQQDRMRSIAPLRVPSDAIVIDSTRRSISQVVDLIMDKIEERQHLQQ